ncbi:MAG: hypothetical protein HY556_00975 [Euryarchaeota archaeon]|nr:hypothetical protein [Euryarchaeota archaeon]
MPIDELRPRAATITAVLTVLLMLSGALPVTPAAAAPDDLPQLPCDDFTYVAGQGQSCRLDNGLWAIKRQDGAIMYSHGPDPAPPAPGSGGPDVPAAPPAAPACAPSSDLYAGLLIYTYPPNKTNRSSTMVPSIRSMMNQVNGVLREEAAEFGYVANYEMRCLSDGTTLRVDSVMLDTVSGSDTFSSITSELASRGYTDYRTKYWV